MARLPLEGIRVIDSSYVFALPYAGGILADMGAEVIKIEGPGRIDTTRAGAFSGAYADNSPRDDPWNRTASFNMLNRGKKSLVLDLSKDEGLAVLKDLIKESDIVMENFTPRVMRRWGLDYPNMKKLKPSIIMVSNTGYGHGEGPYSEYPGQATTQEATHGLTHITGYRGDIPSKAGQSYVDFLACWSALLGIALALRHRNRTGKGLWIDIGMYQLGCYTTSEYIMDWIANSRRGERMGNRHTWRAAQGWYPCGGDAHVCVLGDDGRVRCWGHNGAGQLGDGTQTERHLPVDVGGTRGVAGDANCDAEVNSIDAALALQRNAGLTGELPCEENADVDGDGEVSSIDAALILQFVAGLLAGLPP